MINFEEELKKFQPSLEVEEAVDAIYNRDLTDVADILADLMREAKQNNRYQGRSYELLQMWNRD